MLLSAIQPIKNKFKSLRTSGSRLEASSNCCLTTLTKVNKVLETRRKENQQIPCYFFVQNIILNFLSPLKIFFILSVINDHCGDRLELLFSIIFFQISFPPFKFRFFSLEFGAFECLFIDVARTCVFRPRGRFNKLLPIEKEILKNHVLVCSYLTSSRDSGVSERVVKMLNLVPKLSYLTGQV